MEEEPDDGKRKFSRQEQGDRKLMRTRTKITNWELVEGKIGKKDTRLRKGGSKERREIKV